MHSTIQEILTITEPHIEEAAVHANVPIELYYYAELGMDYFSVEEFQQRDPFTNPEQFKTSFARFQVKNWIETAEGGGRYRVTEQARTGVREIVQAGDDYLVQFESTTDMDLARLHSLLKQIVMTSKNASEPPLKWAITKRFHTSTVNSPIIVKIRECLMDLFAYRDDAHISAARPHFKRAGIVWLTLDEGWNSQIVTAKKLAQVNTFRGYADSEFSAALQAATQVGWLEETKVAGTYRPTAQGREIREQVEELTETYFYAPWATLTQDDLDELQALLETLLEQIGVFRKSVKDS